MSFNPNANNGGSNPRWGPDGRILVPVPGGGYYVPFMPQGQPFVVMPAPVYGPPAPVYGHAPVYGPPPAYGPAPPNEPVTDDEFPAANLTNSTGGVGSEPGYNVFHPKEYTKVHVFRTGETPPWMMPEGFSFPLMAVHVPTNTTIGELLAGFGATNPDPSKNKVWECIPGATNNKWYKGMCFTGNNGDDLGKSIKSVGWDKSRTGLPGGKPVVYLYIVKG